ncbi:MAG TPA: ATP-binding cassette domain-containing protein [Gemmatimonadales bacterium]|nr:ATP-binding cassette domain-containing protein [Gemmatimonadales bacterium]
MQALRGADFILEEGEIHALLGENGAGKSTLMGIAFGLVTPDAGQILVRGTPQQIRGPLDARRLGIGMVHQHFTSVPALSVAENIGLTAGWPVSPVQLSRRVQELGEQTGLPLAPVARAEDLPAVLKQRLEVLKALATDARILLLDEPSSVLSPAEAESLLTRIQDFRTRGMSAVLITHKLDEAIRVADRITVLRRGEVVHTGSASAEPAARLAALMIGDPAWAPQRVSHSTSGGDVRVRAHGLAVERSGPSGVPLREATFHVRSGEVVGIAAVEGNGQRELLRAVAGLLSPSRGELTVSAPVSFVPEDRTSEALIGEFSLAENLAMAQGKSGAWVRGPWLDWGAVERRTQELLGEFSVRAPGPRTPAIALSGGNQQRMVLASALERQPAVLVAENPTRGLDIKATAEIHARLREAAKRGVAVLFHSSDLDEVIELADRVLVVREGQVSELPPRATRQEIGARMLVEVPGAS